MEGTASTRIYIYMNGHFNKVITGVISALALAGIIGGISMNTRLAVAEDRILQSDENEKEIEKKVDKNGEGIQDIKILIERLIVQQELANQK